MLGDITQLLIEPIIGWRGWALEDARADDGGHEGTGWTCELKSPQQGTLWRRGTLSWDGVCNCSHAKRDEYRGQLIEMQSRIAEVESGDHEYNLAHVEAYLTPMRMTCEYLCVLLTNECHCGINAFASPQHMFDASYTGDDNVRVIGEVELTGNVQGFERGWRGERGKVVRIWAVDETPSYQYQIAATRAGAEFMGVWTGEPA